MTNRHPDRLRQRLRDGDTVVGFMAAVPSVSTVQLLSAAGADFVIIDMEHGPIDVGMAQAMIAASAGCGAAPLVRVPWTEPWLAKPVLDSGAAGINFPMVRTADDARRSVAAVRYPPRGGRGYAPSAGPARWNMAPVDYLRMADESVLNVVTIEDPEGITNLDAILAVPGLDVVVIASFDLSMSMGIPGKFDDPDLLALVRVAERKILASGLPLGGVALTAEAVNAKRAAGYRMLLAGFDVLLMESAASAALAAARG